MRFKRIFLVVLDSVGIGAAPDAAKFNDQGADTLGHIAEATGGLNMPHMGKLGLSNIREIKGIAKSEKPQAYYGKMQETSNGKDTMTGHWEIMGLFIDTPFQTFPAGFPNELIDQLEAETGRKVIANKPASGTEVIEEYGKEHMETGALIVYTSADSVLQIAAHEQVIPIAEQYRICEIARKLTKNETYMVGRVIARPFIGEPGAFERTANRHDYALKPFGRTVLNELKDEGYDVVAIGKINDIYDGEGVTKSIRTVSNDDGMTKLIETLDMDFTGLSFLNLVDFDAKYGHRRDPEGYAKALEAYDARLPEVLERMKDDDLLLITADHGNDPTYEGTDHTREYVPLLAFHNQVKTGTELPLRETFADIGATIAANFKVDMPKYGKSFLDDVKYRGMKMASFEQVNKAAAYINKHITEAPKIGLILGSGLGELAESITAPVKLAYDSIPGFPVSTVAGHAGQLVLGKLSGTPTVAMQGRFHFYEGYSLDKVTFPVSVMKALGVETLIVTNAAGGINAAFEPGDLMVISDHLNLMGTNPLIGPNDPDFGVRFPDMSEAYAKPLQTVAHEVARTLNLSLKSGVYIGLTGPTYETPAEIRMFRTLGGDAVGMSTVPEVIVARHAGIEVLGISCITNMASGMLDEPLSHEEVIMTTTKVKQNFMLLITEIVKQIN